MRGGGGGVKFPGHKNIKLIYHSFIRFVKEQLLCKMSMET